MVQLNSRSEVADFLDVNQFEPAHSSYECVAYSVSLCKFAGEPNHGSTGTVLQASNLAQYWYGVAEGSNTSSNENGMSLDAEHTMLTGISLHWHDAPITGNNSHDLEYVKAWLSLGYPLTLCGAETGMVDVGLGDKVPYNWTPSGYHCIVATGVTADGNLLVHDCANVDANGIVRKGPRIYDASKLELISATAIVLPWLARPAADFDPTVPPPPPLPAPTSFDTFYFEEKAGTLVLKTNPKIVLGNKLAIFYLSLGGPKVLRLPLTGELVAQDSSGKPVPGVTYVVLQTAIMVRDPKHLLGGPQPEGSVAQSGDCYLLRLDTGPGAAIMKSIVG